MTTCLCQPCQLQHSTVSNIISSWFSDPWWAGKHWILRGGWAGYPLARPVFRVPCVTASVCRYTAGDWMVKKW